MAKAVLVMDMPESCSDCQLADDDPSGLYFRLQMIIMTDQTVRRIERVFARFGNCRRNQIIQSIVTMEDSMQAGTDA